MPVMTGRLGAGIKAVNLQSRPDMTKAPVIERPARLLPDHQPKDGAITIDSF